MKSPMKLFISLLLHEVQHDVSEAQRGEVHAMAEGPSVVMLSSRNEFGLLHQLGVDFSEFTPLLRSQDSAHRMQEDGQQVC